MHLIIGLLLSVLIMWAGMQAMSIPSRLLQNKFRALGTLKGKSKAEIVAAVGPPKGIQGVGDGKINMMWQRSSYIVVLIFENDVCQGVSTEIESHSPI